MSYEKVKHIFNSATSDYSTDKIDIFLQNIFNNTILNEIERVHKKNLKIFEVGCGNGRWMKYIFNKSSKSIVKIDGCDLSPNLISIARNILKQPIEDKISEISSSNFINFNNFNNQYDILYFFDVIQHINKKDYSLILNKAKKLLSTNGILIIVDKEKFSYYGLKMAIKRIFKLVPTYYLTARYPSFIYLFFLAKINKYKLRKFKRLNQFREICLEK